MEFIEEEEEEEEIDTERVNIFVEYSLRRT